MFDIEEAIKVEFEFENKDFFRGYNYANVAFVDWFWRTVNSGTMDGTMCPEMQEIKEWIINHR